MVADRRLTVLLDGWCVLCDAASRLLLAADRGRRLRLLAQQTDGAELLAGGPAPGDYVVAVEASGRILAGAGAVRAILWRLPPRYRLLAVLLEVVPRPLQASAYRVVAARRYRWLGRKTSCSVPRYRPPASR